MGIWLYKGYNVRFVARFGIDETNSFRVIDIYDKETIEHKISKDDA